jgi:lambda family phage tail tape measure protein
MNIGELTATLGADIKELRASVDKAEKIVREYSRTVDKELDKTDRSWNKTGNTVHRQTTRINKDIKSTSESMKQMKSHALALRSAVSIIGTGIALKSIFDVGKEVDMLKISYKAIFGTMEKAADEFKYVKQVSDEMGQNFYVIAKQFKSLSAASKGTTLEGKGVHDIFRAITKASASLGLTAYETEGALYAVQQMISKATVQSEELRGQLGERLPGAFRMAAEAMGLTMPQLSKQLELGNIMAEDLLPKLARVLEDTYSGEVSEAVEASNKLSEAWKTLRYNIAKSGFLSEASHSVMSLAQTMDSPALQSGLRDIGVGLGQMIKDSRRLIPLLKDLTSGLGGVVSVLGRLSDVYSAFPSEITSGAGAGIIMRILTGSTPVGVVTALLVTLNQAMDKLNGQYDLMLPTLKQMGKEGSDFARNIQNIMGVLRGELDWQGGAPKRAGSTIYPEERASSLRSQYNNDPIRGASSAPRKTELGLDRSAAERRAYLREKYAGTRHEYEKELLTIQAKLKDEYEAELQAKLKHSAELNRNQAKHKNIIGAEQSYYALATGKASPGLTKEQILAQRAAYKELEALRTKTYEKELQELKALKVVKARDLRNELAAEEWFQIKKKELQDKYKKNYVLGNSESGNYAALRKEAADYAATIPNLAEKRAAHQGVDLDAIRKEYKKKIEFQEQWKEMHAKATMSATDFELYQLNKTLELVEDNVENKAELYEWYVARRNEILKENDLPDNWLDASKEALDDFHNGLESVADSTKSIMKDALNGIADTTADFVATGKASWKDLEQSIIKSISNITTKYLMSQVLMGGGSFGEDNVGGLIGMGIGMFGSFFGGGGNMVSHSNQTSLSGNASTIAFSGVSNAHGNVFPAGPSLSAYSNSIVSKPTTFAFAKGAGLMGEAGYEGILPLKRMSNNNLGVEAEIQHPNQEKRIIEQNFEQNFHINVQAGPDGKIAQESLRQMQRKLGRSMNNAMARG